MGAAESWLDLLYQRGVQATQSEAVPAPKPRKKPALKKAWIQTRAPIGDDPGAVEYCSYTIKDGVLTPEVERRFPHREPEVAWVV